MGDRVAQGLRRAERGAVSAQAKATGGSAVPSVNMPSPWDPFSPTHICACPAFFSDFPCKFGASTRSVREDGGLLTAVRERE